MITYHSDLANAEDFVVKNSPMKSNFCAMNSYLLCSEEKYFRQILSDCFKKYTCIMFALRNPANVDQNFTINGFSKCCREARNEAYEGREYRST